MAAYTNPLLTDDELAELTGFTSPKSQRRWLAENNIRFLRRPDGRPRTTWGLVESAFNEQSTGPNFNASHFKATA